MHAQRIVQRFVEGHFSAIHAARRAPLAQAVGAVMRGSALSLMRLARAISTDGTLKAALKRVDRLIGNGRIDHEAQVVGRALLEQLHRCRQDLWVIAIDWSAASPGGQFAELRAVLSWPGMGRGLSLYQQVYAQSLQGSAQAENALLECLRQWIPAAQKVVVITDAGFRQRWFAQLDSAGWQWIGRVRGSVYVRHAQRWATLNTWFTKALGNARRWQNCALTKRSAWPCDVVLVRQGRLGRKRYGRPGHTPTGRHQRDARASAHEPWLLAHSVGLRHYRPEQIVAMYAQRMQIEENFRDSKSLALGMGLELARSRSASRLHALLLINTIAAFLLWHIGQLAEAEGLHRRFKATTRRERELSIITLALLLCTRPTITLSDHGIHALEQRLGVRL